MMHTPPSQYHAVDWCAALRHVGAIGDVPVPEIFPFLFAQHSDARVVLTVRNSVDWFARRAGWGRSGRAKTGANWSDPAPLGWVSWESAAQAYITAKPTSSGARPTQNVDEFMRHLGGTASDAGAYCAGALAPRPTRARRPVLRVARRPRQRGMAAWYATH